MQRLPPQHGIITSFSNKKIIFHFFGTYIVCNFNSSIRYSCLYIIIRFLLTVNKETMSQNALQCIKTLENQSSRGFLASVSRKGLSRTDNEYVLDCLFYFVIRNEPRLEKSIYNPFCKHRRNNILTYLFIPSMQ